MMTTLNRKRRLQRLKKLKRQRLKRRIISISILTIIVLILINIVVRFNDEQNELTTKLIQSNTDMSIGTNVNACENENRYPMKPDRLKQDYYNYLIKMAEQENVHVEALLSIITAENRNYKETLYNKNNNGSIDIGLCQINSNYIKYFEDKYNFDNFDPESPYDSIEFLAKHFAYLSNYGIDNYNLDKMDSYIFAAGAYNRGLSNECKYRNNYEYKEKFLNYYNEFTNSVK